MPCGIYWRRAELALKWVARIWSIPTLLLLFGIFFESIIQKPPPNEPRSLVEMLLVPGGICLGILLGWKWQGLGGIICAVSFIVFYIVLWTQGKSFPTWSFFLFFAIPGILFFASWLLECRNRRMIKIERLIVSRRDNTVDISRE